MKKLAAILFFWFPFSLAALVAIPRLLWAMLTEHTQDAARREGLIK